MTADERQTVVNRMEARQQPAHLDEHGLLYRLYVPRVYKDDRQFPLVISLHSAAGNGDDNTSQLDQISRNLVSSEIQNKFAPFVVVPQCPKGQQWTSRPFSAPPLKNFRLADTPESSRIRALIRLIRELQKEFSIDPNRIYISGFSMGSSAVWDILVRYPDVFSGAITMSGVSAPHDAKRITHIPIWTFHGYFDRISPITNSIEMYDALQKQGGNMRLKKMLWGHTVINLVAADNSYLEWLLSQKRIQPVERVR